MATSNPKTNLNEIEALDQRITVIREEIQRLKAEGLSTGKNLPVLKKARKNKLEAELQQLLQKRRLLKEKSSQPSPPVDEYSV